MAVSQDWNVETAKDREMFELIQMRSGAKHLICSERNYL